RLDLDALVSIVHGGAPDHRRQRAAGHAIGRAVVVVADPNAGDEIAGVADKPSVAIIVGGAGLAGDPHAVDHRAPAGAFLGGLVHHKDHVHGNLFRQHLARLRAVAIEAPDHVAGPGADLEDGV